MTMTYKLDNNTKTSNVTFREKKSYCSHAPNLEHEAMIHLYNTKQKAPMFINIPLLQRKA